MGELSKSIGIYSQYGVATIGLARFRFARPRSAHLDRPRQLLPRVRAGPSAAHRLGQPGAALPGPLVGPACCAPGHATGPHTPFRAGPSLIDASLFRLLEQFIS